MKSPRIPRPGSRQIPYSFLRDAFELAESFRAQPLGLGTTGIHTPGGVNIDFARRPLRGGAAAAAAKHPFQLYQYTPNPASPTSGDWRTFRVKAGTVNGLHPDNDDAAGSPLDIIVPASTTAYKIWLKCTISVALDADEGKVTAVTIDKGASLPAQPNGNSTTGAPPGFFYILIGSVTTVADPGPLASNQPSQNISTSLWVDEVSFGNPSCGTNGWITQKRMSAGMT